MLQGTADPFETFVSQWLRMEGYLVQTPVNFRRPGGKEVRGDFWSDVDVVGTRGTEIVIVECKEWISTSKKAIAEEVEKKFKDAKSFFDDIGLTKGKSIKFIFAQIHIDQEVKDLLRPSAQRLGSPIEYVDFNQIFNEMIDKIRPFITKTQVGKFGEPISWLLSRLVYFKFIKEKDTA
jgi:Holliday junction resolvase